MLIGGALEAGNKNIYDAILEARDGDGPVCVIPTAGASPRESMASAVNRIDHWGGDGTAHGILITVSAPDRAFDPEVVEEIRGCSGFFFTGGVQARISRVFLPKGEMTPVYHAVLERYREGAVVSGSSAGASIMSDPMISGGTSEDAFSGGVVGANGTDGVQLLQGMGLIRGIPIDQHFLARGRIGRLMTVVLEEEDVSHGLGIDENTALVVRNGRGRVVGASGVIWVDGSRAHYPSSSSARLAAEGLVVELLGEGDEIDMNTGSVTPAAGKERLGAVSPLASRRDTSRDEQLDRLFNRWVFLHVLNGMATDGGADRSVEVEGHRIQLRGGDGFRGVAWPERGVRGTPYGLSVGPIEVDILGPRPQSSASRPGGRR